MKFKFKVIETTYLDRKVTSISTTFFNLRYVVSVLSSNKKHSQHWHENLVSFDPTHLIHFNGAKQQDSPGHVSDGVAAASQEHERQVVLLHELDALGVTCRT